MEEKIPEVEVEADPITTRPIRVEMEEAESLLSDIHILYTPSQPVIHQSHCPCPLPDSLLVTNS
jgi:hypothetical protein